MLELRLRSGQIVSFDGRVLEVFAPAAVGERLHVANVAVARTPDPGGGSTIVFGEARLGVRFAPEETPAAERLLAALEQAQRSDGRLALR